MVPAKWLVTTWTAGVTFCAGAEFFYTPSRPVWLYGPPRTIFSEHRELISLGQTTCGAEAEFLDLYTAATIMLLRDEVLWHREFYHFGSKTCNLNTAGNKAPFYTVICPFNLRHKSFSWGYRRQPLTTNILSESRRQPAGGGPPGWGLDAG